MSNEIILRKLKNTDTDILYPLTSDSECGKYMKSGAHTSLAQTQNMVDEYCKDENLGFIVETSENEIVGYISLAKKEGDSHSLSVMTFPKFWKMGYTTIATKLIIEEAKKSNKVASIISYVVDQNIGSCRIMEKCGFELKEVINDEGRIVNVYYLEI